MTTFFVDFFAISSFAIIEKMSSGLQGIGGIKSILCITCIKYKKIELTITIRFFVFLLRLDYRLGIFLS